MGALRLSLDLTLPFEAVTQTFGILGQKGSGKTTAAAVMVEEMLRHHLPVAVIDPTGGWWSLRASRDEARPGFPITVLGGEHGDLPLESTGGAVIIDRWRAALKLGERKMLDALERSKDGLLREELGKQTGFAYDGGTFAAYLSRLKRLELVAVRGQHVRMIDWMYDELNS